MKRKKLLVKAVCILLLLVSSSDMLYAGGNTEKTKYIFLFIGDGMAVSQVALTEVYLGTLAGKRPIPLHFSQFPCQGMTRTYSLDSLIPDSAAAATALATGYKTNNGIVSQSPDGKSLKTLMEIAKEKGLCTGITTTTRISHATPGAFMAHNPDRDNENDIAAAISLLGVDFLAGGGYRHFISIDREPGVSKREDSRDLLREMEKKGYRIFVTEKETDEFLRYSPGKNDKVMALFGPSHLSHEIDRYNMGLPEPSLAQMTKKGIDVLFSHSRGKRCTSSNKIGFFYVIEGGRIDYGGHNQDAVTSIYDVLAFNDAVEEAIRFYHKHPKETLIIVTGDHETGGLALGCARTEKTNDLTHFLKQTISYERFDTDILKLYKQTQSPDKATINDLKIQIETSFGLDFSTLSPLEMDIMTKGFEASMRSDTLNREDELIHILYGLNDPLLISITHIISQRAGVCWTSFDHTGAPVATYALGKGANLFDGYYESAEICKKITAVMTGEKVN